MTTARESAALAADAPPAGTEPEPPPATRRELFLLHGGLFASIVVWSFMHVVISVPLRRGANLAVISVYREVIGALALGGAAHALERRVLGAAWSRFASRLTWPRVPRPCHSDVRPPVDRQLLRLFAVNGALFAAIRLSILAALANAGPDITAAIVPVTPVATLFIALALRVETLDVRSWPGAIQLSGMLLCTLSSVLMAFLRGPLLFGTPPHGAHAPAHVAAGVNWMLLNTLLSAVVQVVNKRILARFPTISTMAAIAVFAVLFLIRASRVLLAWSRTSHF